MFDAAGVVFFNALREVAERRLGRGHPCFASIEKAADDGGPDATKAAQEALAALDPELAATLMADVHKALRENPATILGAWGSAGARH